MALFRCGSAAKVITLSDTYSTNVNTSGVASVTFTLPSGNYLGAGVTKFTNSHANGGFAGDVTFSQSGNTLTVSGTISGNNWGSGVVTGEIEVAVFMS